MCSEFNTIPQAALGEFVALVMTTTSLNKSGKIFNIVFGNGPLTSTPMLK